MLDDNDSGGAIAKLGDQLKRGIRVVIIIIR